MKGHRRCRSSASASGWRESSIRTAGIILTVEPVEHQQPSGLLREVNAARRRCPSSSRTTPSAAAGESSRSRRPSGTRTSCSCWVSSARGGRGHGPATGASRWGSASCSTERCTTGRDFSAGEFQSILWEESNQGQFSISDEASRRIRPIRDSLHGDRRSCPPTSPSWSTR